MSHTWHNRLKPVYIYFRHFDCCMNLTLSGFTFYSLNSHLLQHDLDSISHWCDANKLVLNAKKSSVMFICSPQKMLTLNTENVCLTLNNQVLNVQKEQKVLGVTIDFTLSWRSHIINMCKKLSQLLGLLWRVRFLLNKNAKIMFYNSLILSRLSYCLNTLGQLTQRWFAEVI